MSDRLVAWLREQVEVDEQVAKDAADGDSGQWFMGDKWNVYRVENEALDEADESNALVVYGNVKPQSGHIALHDPARALAEVEFKRKLIADFENDVTWSMDTLRDLARTVYRDRPGYDEAVKA